MASSGCEKARPVCSNDHTSRTQAYTRKGVKRLFPWQAAALMCAVAPCHRRTLPACPRGSSCDTNLLYTAPTSGGKSVVAELLMARALVATQSTAPPRKGARRPRTLVCHRNL